MAKGGGTARRLLRAAALGCGVGLLPGQAQEDAGGLVVTASIAPRLEWSDNLDFTAAGEAGYRASMALSFGIESTTRTQRLAFTAGTSLTQDSSTGDTGFEAPDLRFSWSRENRSSLVAASLAFRDADVSSLVAEDAFDPDSLIVDSGRRRTLSASLSLDFGREAPFGGRLALNHDRTEYRETTDPDLIDSRSDGVSLALRFAVDPRITVRANAGMDTADTDGGIDSEVLRAGIGAGFDASQTLNVGADLGWSRTERSGALSDTDEGLSLGLDATLTLPNGSLAGVLTSSVAENGRRTEVRVTRALELQRGRLSFSAGATRTEGFKVQPLLGIDYVHDLPRAQLSVVLNQRTDTDIDGDETLLSSLSVGYRQDLSAVSSLSASVSLRDVNVLEAGGEDTNRVDLSVRYTHALTEDWGLSGGITHTTNRSSAAADVSSNTVFVGLDRTFRWRP